MEGDTIVTQEIFRFAQQGIDSAGKAHGHFESTGVRPNFVTKLREASIHLPPDLFRQRALLEA